jgi:hypothetical protein
MIDPKNFAVASANLEPLTGVSGFVRGKFTVSVKPVMGCFDTAIRLGLTMFLMIRETFYCRSK